ncbi:hypothetical protein [Streptococcus merionis]|uniref:hypothetical protein n=1 Tax=Streptococcus merionis TaxID=400065 RepID=UPI003517480C
MALFEVKCNLVLEAEGKNLLPGNVIELTKERAKDINTIVKDIFPDIPQALVPVEPNDAPSDKSKRTRKKVVEDSEADK